MTDTSGQKTALSEEQIAKISQAVASALRQACGEGGCCSGEETKADCGPTICVRVECKSEEK
jgi:hypothetical protein